MSNQLEYSEEYETQLTKKNLFNLRKFLVKLNRNNDWENPQVYHITEYFPFDKAIMPVTKYDLRNIKMSIENDSVVYCNDAEGILEENMYNNSPLRLQTIIIDDIMNIEHQGKIITIWMSDGYIMLEY